MSGIAAGWRSAGDDEGWPPQPETEHFVAQRRRGGLARGVATRGAEDGKHGGSSQLAGGHTPRRGDRKGTASLTPYEVETSRSSLVGLFAASVSLFRVRRGCPAPCSLCGKQVRK